MADDPVSRDGILASRALNSLRLLAELREMGLRPSPACVDLIRELIERERLEMARRRVLDVLSGGPARHTPAVTPIRGEAPKREKTTARETAARPAVPRVPDVVQVITAYRAWRFDLVQAQARLLALGLEVTWEPRQKMEAECRRPPALRSKLVQDEAWRGEHQAPVFHCRCGIWGFKTLENLLSALGPEYKFSVMGKVSLWGRVIETENGYRAQYAYPEELWVWDPYSSAEKLGLVYGVPVKISPDNCVPSR